MIAWNLELCSSPPDYEIERIRVFRRIAAQQEASEKVKVVRKSHQRRVKAATILLEYFSATGRFSHHAANSMFPDELRFEMTVLLALMHNSEQSLGRVAL